MADERAVNTVAAEMEEGGRLTELKGVGPKLAERLQKLGIERLQDLLFHLPMRWEDRTRVVPMGSLRPGDRAVVEGTIQHAETVFRRRRSLLVSLSDGSGAVTLRFFHFSRAQQENLKRGVKLRCYGEARRGRVGLELVHPEYRRVSDDMPVEETLTPVYPATEGLQQARLRDLINQALDRIQKDAALLADYLPPATLPEALRMDLFGALDTLHRPPPSVAMEALMEGSHPARRRLAFEELLAHRLSLRLARARFREDLARPLPGDDRLVRPFLESLAFSLTGAQQRVREEVFRDLEGEAPMLRLVQGDVGSGKTVIAVLAALRAVEAGGQVAVMAPTEILAEQHLGNFTEWLKPLGIRVGWLSGKQASADRRWTLKAIAHGELPVVVGTHALFQEQVRFRDLALAVVDEQHRFGVHQRLALREKGEGEGRRPHQLIMTATPIPRTLAMTAYADLDVSVIDELPPGREPVKTVALSETRRSEVVARVAEACGAGRQVYWVCPLVEESDVLQCQAAEDSARVLAEALPDISVGLIHGRMKAEDKESVMARFKAGEIQLLVATTVIEVGVNVPNASLMIIENAERLGLSQLHQLRGRVGRGSTASSCVLLYRGPLNEIARARLQIMRETNDGFQIARRDLELRGPGEVLGTRQTGAADLRIADLMRDNDLLPEVAKAAEAMLQKYPEAAEALMRRWVGESSRYVSV
ncbi:ATP-dependent DNA helicase RecG [Natronospira bacteriovora]|uniref:ATP-dependent DNA helicase RecG n=1 Tax=Natronospira bacteriovora TaxID=3069753 RepID=A0ABU0W828_9GAMM|nr:ATP-dependent DNA helicase RecG [Natronospira sp. AB-CW4]MDQ2070188.1 ATP-dependent DNA helicase RecG [Natronospira sp. AB-CW4]